MSVVTTPITTNVDFEQDGKQVSYLKVPHTRNDSAWGAVLIPITVIQNGKGPSTLLVGGSHGGEYEGVVSLLKLSSQLEPKAIQGRIIILPALNLPAVVGGTRLSPLDQKDMNRSFPGSPTGTITEVIAHYVHDVILPLADAVLDIHSGGFSLKLEPYISMHYLDDPKQSEATFAALQAFQAPIGIIMREFSGEGLLDYAVEGMGKLFLCAELGGGGELSTHTLHIAEVGIRNLLYHLGHIKEEDTYPHQQPIETQFMQIPTPHNYHIVTTNGIFEAFQDLGQWVEEGQPLGQVHFLDHRGWQPEQIFAQCSGRIIGTRAPSHVKAGDCVYVIAQPLENPTFV